MSNPSDPLTIVLIGHLCCDPAIDTEAQDASRALTVYERSRSEGDRKAIPLRPSARPCLFTLKPLTASSIRFVKGGNSDEEKVQRAVVTACHEYTDERGLPHRATEHGKVTEIDKRFSVGSDEWLDHLIETFGNSAIQELAAVVIQRAEASPKALAPFRLPRGSMLRV